MDRIIIGNLRIYAHHGVYREENEKGQNFYINAVLETDTRKAGTLDDLDLSTNYGEVCAFLSDFVQKNTYRLIETVAEKTAEALLLTFPLVRKVTLEVRKPEAPVPLPFESVSVRITRGWHRTYLSCGSNMGDRNAHLDGALQALRADDKCHVLQESGRIVTAPYGGVEQEDFLNSAVALETLYTPRQLLGKIHEIERAHGRERKVRWGPRTLDVDILLYEDCIMHTEELVIPHIDMQNRHFVLQPLSQIAPYERHPLLGVSVKQMYETLMACQHEEIATDVGGENKAGMQGHNRADQSEQKKAGTCGKDTERGASIARILRARRLTLEETREIYETHIRMDFPPEEIKPFSVISKMWNKGSYHAYGFYEAADVSETSDPPELDAGNAGGQAAGSADERTAKDDSGTLCAYAFLLADNKEHVLLLDYFAVPGSRRGEGIGSCALSLLREVCADWGALVIEVEDDELVEIGETTRAMRRRRIAFYTAAGCLMTHTRSRVWGVDYRIMALPLSDALAVERIDRKVTSLYAGMYDEENMKKHFAITAV